MKIAIIDCFAGISGDMTLGALINAGVPVDFIKSEIKKLNLSKFEIKIQKTKRHYISAIKANVDFDDSEQPERKYVTIKSMIENSGLSKHIKERSLLAFKILGEAEAKIHSKNITDIHFHEVGAVDSIVDLVGSIIGFDYLGIEKIYGMPVPLGTGFTKTEHGVMPVPSPAALEILKDYPVISKNSNFEMTTPTGATLLKVLVDEMVPNNLNYSPKFISYGAGSKETELWPNLLRLIIAEQNTGRDKEQLILIEANIDDMSPEIYPYVMDKALKAGANDVFLTNIIMKKGRPGTMISILAAYSLIEKMETILFENTTTIGLRKFDVKRSLLPRRLKKIKTKYGDLLVKVIEINGKEIYRPEFEECKKLADENNVSIVDILHLPAVKNLDRR